MEDIFFSFTFGGEALSLAASLTTINEIKKKKIIPYLWKQGKYLKEKTEELIKDNDLDIEIKGMPCWQIFKIKDIRIKSFIQQELLKRGILWTGSHNMSFSHKKKDIDKLINAYKEIFPLLKKDFKLESKSILGNYKTR